MRAINDSPLAFRATVRRSVRTAGLNSRLTVYQDAAEEGEEGSEMCVADPELAAAR